MSTPPLLAILLVTSSNLTSPSKHILFHYPPYPTPQSSLADEEIPDDSSSETSSSTTSSSTTTSTLTASLQSSKYSRLTSENNNNRYTIDEDEEHHDGFDHDEEDDRLSPWYRKQPRKTEWQQDLFDLSKRDLADFLTPKDSLCNRKFELGVEDIVFLGHPTHLTGVYDSNLLATSPSSSINDDADNEAIISKVKLTKFHIVFVMNPSWRLDYHEQVSKMYNEIVKKFTDACTLEQQERGYVSLEAFKIYKIIRDAEERELPMSLVWEELIQKSNLVHAISTLYNSIIHNKVAFIDLNNSIELAFHIKQISQISSLPELGTNPFNEKNIPLLSTAHGFSEKEDEADQVLAPRYTLLLMDEPSEILKKVPSRPSQRRENWIQFVNAIKPTITFRKLARDQRLPLSLVLSMARDLLVLDMARPIPPLTNRAIYIVSPISPISALSSQSRTFKSRFPTAPPLPQLLSTISSGPPRRWDTILAQYPSLPESALLYLMRTGWLIQLKEFYFIRIPREIKLLCIDAADRKSTETAAEDSIIVNPFRASREELKWIKKLAERVEGSREGRMFERLGKYFDGKSAKDKILRREQVDRSELEGMIEAVRKVGGIVVAKHW